MPEGSMFECRCCGVRRQPGEESPCGCYDSVEWYMSETGEVECSMHRTKRWVREAKDENGLLNRIKRWFGSPSWGEVR